MTSNGDTYRNFRVAGTTVRGLGSFHKTLEHNEFGEVNPVHFEKLIEATEGHGAFRDVPLFQDGTARLTNPQAGLAHDRLTLHPASYSMPPAPTVLSITTAAEMTELYWMAHLRDLSFDQFATDPSVALAAKEIGDLYKRAAEDRERSQPWGQGNPLIAYQCGKTADEDEVLTPLPSAVASQLTIEGELNKLAANVALGRSMGGVHWRTDNSRSLILGEAIACRLLADITTDLNEKPYFEFRSFSRKSDGQPKLIKVQQGRVLVDGVMMDSGSSAF